MKINFTNIFHSSLDSITIFFSSSYPLKNIAKEISNKKNLNSTERKIFFDLIFLWSREYFLLRNFLIHKDKNFVQLQKMEQQKIMLRIFLCSFTKTEDLLSKIYDEYISYVDSLKEDKYFYMLDDKLYALLKESYGNECVEIVKSIFQKPARYFAVENPVQNMPNLVSYLKEKEIKYTLQDLTDTAIKIHDHVNLEKLPAKINDFVWPMDVVSQFIASLIKPKEGESVLDLCGGMGNKTRFLSSNCKDLTYLEKDEKRFLYAKKRLSNKNIKFICADGTKNNLTKNSFDWILLDAPCSGTGTFRHHPDLMLRWEQNYNKDILELQSKLLHSALELLKPNGRLIYVTCSLLEEENQKQIEKVVSADKNVRLIELELLKLKSIQKNGVGYNFFSHIYDSDSFFISCLSKF